MEAVKQLIICAKHSTLGLGMPHQAKLTSEIASAGISGAIQQAMVRQLPGLAVLFSRLWIIYLKRSESHSPRCK